MTEKFAAKAEPGAEEIAFYREHGYVYLEGFYDYETEIKPIQEDIFRLIGILAEQYDIPLGTRRFSSETFDQGLQYLIKHHRPVVGVLYDAVKKLPNYVRLAAHPLHDIYGRALMGSRFVGFANRGYGIRMDNPDEGIYSTQLHQDYVSQLCSQRGIVTWSPLRDVTPNLGPVHMYPGSHACGIFPIVKTREGSQGLVVQGAEQIAARFSEVAPLVQIGDCVIMDALMLHKSGTNISSQTRWAMLSRYFDFTDTTGKAINWKGGLQEGNSFETIHPELTRIETPIQN